MAPMKVYGWAVSPWMARVLVCLEEAGAEYEFVPMSRSGGDHRQRDHPRHRLPGLPPGPTPAPPPSAQRATNIRSFLTCMDVRRGFPTYAGPVESHLSRSPTCAERIASLRHIFPLFAEERRCSMK
ncbi:glutathione S-transferase 4-like [Hordeum vulgare]|nr:glutathione S-transferase 4-like [Hordeum vulgare]